MEIFVGTIIETKAIVTADFSMVETIEYPKTYLESIMLNLLSNALKYRSPQRVPEIHFRTNLVHKQITLEVVDNGLGIDISKYGYKLFGFNNTFHQNKEAKGVGLFITKTQVEAMGGSILAESEVGKRTVFKIDFGPVP